MVPSIRSFRSSRPPPTKTYKDPQLSPTLSATTAASGMDWGDEGPRVVCTRADLRASVTAYEGLLAAAKQYRNAMLALSTASTAFAGALEECARVKGAGESGEHLLAASGLQYMVANSGQVLSDTLYRSFEIPLLHAYDTYVATLATRHAEYEALLAEKTAAIRKTEDENLKQGRKKSRDLSQFRRALEKLQEQVMEVEVCKRTYYAETLENETETWAMISGKVALLLRSTLDLSDRLASKATSDPVIESMLNEHPDPFDSYRTENEEERDVFSILPPLGMNLGLGGSKRGSVVDLDREADREREREKDRVRSPRPKQEDSTATATPRQPARKAVSVGDVLGFHSSSTSSVNEEERQREDYADEQTSTPRHHYDNPFAASSPSASVTSSPVLAASTSHGAIDSPSPKSREANEGQQQQEFSRLSLKTKSPTPTKKQLAAARRGLSRVTEVEHDPMAGDWGAPVYGKSLSPVMNGNGGYDSGEDDDDGLGQGDRR